ncbi:MAG: Signal peptidase-like protein [Bacteroidetes bacterium]|nr:Signal peptidase-like protein [Rhodothermia bacterium]MCS7155023.1 Signal peptidase-like protein [Bacteroidota bacterium]MCX7907307.1 Signal peptidase-like protein [Bacteroidota bacterium]MDW8137966.1 regulatory iron-sulfur-containing complex subunit RicT [Bacteroidota bacterium]MDW8286182.1 regulatory iron-sulfur-containing complex subunit RicT [Bacteroidota bacterium]
MFDWLADFGIEQAAQTFDVVEVSFKGNRKAFYRNEQGFALRAGDPVIVQADRGVDLGRVNLTGELVRLRLKAKGIDPQTEFPLILRRATAEDLARHEGNRTRETEAFAICRRYIERLNLGMKLVDAEWQFDGKKLTFYFTAERRVDFRQLVRELAAEFRTRIELRQIGVRDEAARLGGIGSCGRELCCSTWLQEFKHVSTQAARVQNLPLNPAKLSGQCGRLKCCLNYELEQYLEALAQYPSLGTRLLTQRGEGVIEKIDIFQERLWVHYPESDTWESLLLAEVRRILELNQQGVIPAVQAPVQETAPDDLSLDGEPWLEEEAPADDAEAPPPEQSQAPSRRRRRRRKRGGSSSSAASSEPQLNQSMSSSRRRRKRRRR